MDSINITLNDFDFETDSFTSSPHSEIGLNAKFMYRHQKHTASKLKKSKSAYMFFSADVRATLKQQGAKLGPNEIMKEISDQWKALSKKDKAVYEAQAQQDRERYRLEKEEMLKINPSQIAKNRTKNNHIKKPWSAYDFFMNEVYPQVKAENPALYSADILKIVSQKWKALSNSQKCVYQQKSEADKIEKRAQLRAFELKRVLESAQGSPVAESVSTEKKSRKRVKRDNVKQETATSAPSGTYDSPMSDVDVDFEVPTMPTFPCRVDSLLEDYRLPQLNLQSQCSQQAFHQFKAFENVDLQRLPSIDYSSLPPLRLEDFRFGSFIESSFTRPATLESQIKNLLDVEHHPASFENLFTSALSRQPSFYAGHFAEASINC